MPRENQVLERIYYLYPSMAAWARSGRPSALWTTADNAKGAMCLYFGPTASDLFMNSQHILAEDRPFLRSKEAIAAMCKVVDEIYNLEQACCLKNGLFPEPEEKRAPA